MRYKVGDKVKIRTDLQVDCVYGGLLFNNSMKRFMGKIGIIKSIDTDDSYTIDFDNDSCRWWWTNEMLTDIPQIVEPKTVDVGYRLDYCGHRRVLKDVIQGDTGLKRLYYTKDYEFQYILPIECIEFIIPHED